MCVCGGGTCLNGYEAWFSVKTEGCSTCRPVEDEFDQYRAKYRLFDSALFIMSPDNRLRRFCRAVLTRQMSEPPFVRTRLTPVNLIKNRFSYYIR